MGDIWQFDHFILPLIHYSLQHLNCNQSNPFKCFNIKLSYSFLFIRKFREYLFSKGALIWLKKTTRRSIYCLGNYDWGAAYISGDTETIFNQKGPSCKKRNSTWIQLQILFKENMKVLIKTLNVLICP